MIEYDPSSRRSSVPIRRQADTLKVIQEEKLESYFYFIRTREEKAEKYPDYVLAREGAYLTIKRLADIASVVGEECLEAWLSKMEDRAREIAQKREQGRAT